MTQPFFGYTQLTNVPSQQYSTNLISKSCVVADVYDEGIPNNVIIENVNESIIRSLRHRGEQNP